jgi:hypothetical protein
MTKLVVVLAVVVVVILVVVIVAVRNMRGEDPDEFADRPGRGGMRDGRDGREARYGRREPAARPSGRGNPRGGRPSGRPAGSGSRPAGNGRGFDERRDQRGRGYDQPDGYDDDRRFDQPSGRGQDDRRTVAMARPQDRQRGASGSSRRPDDSQPPARARRGRRSDDSSEWDSSEWEKLSDVDYWAELAADKPLTTTAQPAQPSAAPRPSARPRNGRPRPDREAEAPAGRDTGPGSSIRGGAPRRDPATGLPVRGRPQAGGGDLAAAAPGRADFAPAPVPVNGSQDQHHPMAEPHLPPSSYSGPASLPRPVHSLQRDQPPPPADDDPLTSPSFPAVPASDSRSYRNGRASTPARGSRAPEQYLAPTQQFSSYGSPAPQPPAAPQRQAPPQRPAAQPQRQPAPRPAARHRSDPGPDPLAGRNPYPPRSASLPPAPAPSAPAAASNPYGSYVTPDVPASPPGYGGYPAAPGNGHGSYPPAPGPGGGQPAGNDYWQHQQPPAPGAYPGGNGYLNGSAPAADPRDADAGAADYGNGYGRHDAPYPPNGYPAGPPDPSGYAPADPYGGDEYGGYPGYGAGGR